MRAADGTVLLFTTVPGMSITVPPYGNATNTTPVQVPADLRDALCEEGKLSPFAPGDFGPLPTLPDPEPTLTAEGPEYHAEGGKVYHKRRDCPTGNNAEKPLPGTGDLPSVPSARSWPTPALRSKP